MTREEARKAAEVMLAYANGEEIEKLCFEDYVPCKNPSFNWADGKGIENYRIKPKPRYRPFKTKEECWEEMLKHQPFGWVKDEYKYVHIVCVYKNEIEFSPDEDDNSNLLVCIIKFTSAYEQGYTFADGTPFGVKEEE